MEKLRTWATHHRRDLAAYALFLALTCIIAWPSIVRPGRTLFAFHGDALLTVFWLWWFKTAWLQGLPAEPNPMVGAPFGADWGGVVERGTVWPGVLLSALGNETFAFNVMVLVSFPLAAIAAYHLTKRLTHNYVASIVAGLIYAFCPFHLWKSWAWVPLSNIQWMPLYVLALLDLRRTQRPRRAVLAGLWFGVNFVSSYVYGFMLGVLTLIYLIFWGVYTYVTQGRIAVDRRTLLLAGTVVAVAALLVFPVALPIVTQSLTTAPEDAPHKYAWPFEHMYGLVARPTDYIIPPSSSLMWTSFEELDSAPTERGEFTHGLFVGYGALILTGCAVWGWRRKRKERTLSEIERFAIPFLAVLLVAASIISMTPPTLALDLPGLGSVVLKGPGYFTYGLVPWFREYARFGALVMLAVSTLAGWGAAYVLDRLAFHQRWRAVFLIALALALFLDYGFRRPPGGAPPDTGYVPEVYRWLREQPGDFIVAEYPIPRASQVSPNYLLYATVHGKRLVNGHGFSHRSDLLTPALWDLTDLQTPGVLSALGVKYAIVHSTWPGFEQWYAALPDSLEIDDDLALVRQFDTATVLRVQAEPASVIVAPGEGLTLAPDQTRQTSWWWLSNAGRLYLVNTTDRDLQIELRFTVAAHDGAAGLDVYDESGALVPGSLGDSGRVVVGPLQIPPGQLWEQSNPGVVELDLRVVSGGEGGRISLRDFQVIER